MSVESDWVYCDYGAGGLADRYMTGVGRMRLCVIVVVD